MNIQPGHYESPPPTLWQRMSCCAGLGVFCLAFIFLVAVLPIYLILSNVTPPDWGTESEAIRFTESVVNEQLGRPKNEEIDWTPTATMNRPLPPLNQEKRLWNVIGKIVVDPETPRKYHVSACKEPDGRWVLVGIHVDDRTIYFDKKILEPPPLEWYDDPSVWESPIH